MSAVDPRAFLGADVLAEPVVGHAAVDRHVQRRHGGELDRVVGRDADRLGEVEPDLALGHVERGGELDVADMVATQVDVHQAWDERVFGGRPVELDPLHQRRGAVADADDRNPDFLVLPRHLSSSLVG